MNSFRARPGDNLVLLSHSRTPEAMYSWKANVLDADKIVRTLSQNDANTAFWLGLLAIQADASDLAA